MTLDDMILDWNTLREQYPDEDSRDYFDFVEEKVAEELISHRSLFPAELVESSGLSMVSSKEELLADRERLLRIAGTFSGTSIYDVETRTEHGCINLVMSLDNVPQVFSCIMLDIFARLWHVTGGFDMGLILNFQDEDSRDRMLPVLSPAVKGLFPEIVYLGWNLQSELTQSCTTEIVAGRPLNETELARLEELIDELDEETGNTVAVSFTEYINDDSVDSVKIRKSENGYSMQLEINMEDFDWEEPLILAAEKISRPNLNGLINDLFRDGKTTDEIEYIMEHFVQVENKKKDEEEK